MIRKALKGVWQVILKALQQGMTSRGMALTLAMGVVLSIFPVYGITTLLCLLVAILFRLNIIVIQAVNYLMTPVQLVLLIPFLKSGSWLMGLNSDTLTFNGLMNRFKSDFWGVVQELGWVILGGISVWLLIAIPVFLVLFFIAYWILERWRRNKLPGTA
jgi:uncharacterized protein (DUF2062 family)